MSLDIIGPANAPNAVTVRPADTRAFGATDTWMKDCSSATANDGTKLQAGLFNAMLAQFRNLIRGNGLTGASNPVLTEDNTNDSMALTSIQHLIQRAQPKYSHDTGTANHIIVSLTPAPAEYKEGMVIVVKLANMITGATILTANGLANINVVHGDGSVLGYGDGYVGQILGLVYDGANFQIAWRSGQGIIDSAISFTVHGGGANFPDLNAAMEYLSKFTISPNGSVSLNVAIGQYSYGSTSVQLQHPNASRISINGSGIGFISPSASTFAVTGNSSGSRTADRATQLTALRACYPTELQFTGSAGIVVVTPGITINSLLITGNRAGATTSALLSVLAFANLGNISAANGGGYGVLVANGASAVSVGCLSGNGCITAGVAAVDNGSILYGTSANLMGASNDSYGIYGLNGGAIRTNGGALALANGNGVHGVNMSLKSTFQAPAASQFNTNGSAGIIVSNSSNAAAANCTFSGNSAYGVLAQEGSIAQVGSSTFNTNTTFATIAQIGSTIDAASATGVSGSSSPAINTVGNANSYVVN